MENLHTFLRLMAIWVGLGFLLSRLLASRSALLNLNACSCIAPGMSADLSRMFNSTAIAASLTSLVAAAGGPTMGGTGNIRPGGRNCTLSLFFSILLLLPVSDCGLSMETSLDSHNVLGREIDSCTSLDSHNVLGRDRERELYKPGQSQRLGERDEL